MAVVVSVWVSISETTVPQFIEAVEKLSLPPPISLKQGWAFTFKPGKAANGRGGFDGGQETINCEARVKTELGSRGCNDC
jgi:hypothetical protein